MLGKFIKKDIFQSLKNSHKNVDLAQMDVGILSFLFPFIYIALLFHIFPLFYVCIYMSMFSIYKILFLFYGIAILLF